jgi:ubiquinone biosynthesis protein UbiJ
MELGTRELVQFISLVATLAGAFAVVKSQLARVIEDLKAVQKEMEIINTRLDTIESGSAVFKHQVGVLGHILSPTNLDRQSREIAEVKKEVTYLREAADRLYKMHNGTHPK